MQQGNKICDNQYGLEDKRDDVVLMFCTQTKTLGFPLYCHITPLEKLHVIRVQYLTPYGEWLKWHHTTLQFQLQLSYDWPLYTILNNPNWYESKCTATFPTEGLITLFKTKARIVTRTWLYQLSSQSFYDNRISSVAITNSNCMFSWRPRGRIHLETISCFYNFAFVYKTLRKCTSLCSLWVYVINTQT